MTVSGTSICKTNSRPTNVSICDEVIYYLPMSIEMATAFIGF